MNTNHNLQSLKNFEKKIADHCKNGKIKAPIHLRSGNELNLIGIFRGIEEHDYIFNYWASHLHCLLKGVPENELETAILNGNSIALCFPNHNIYCSGIVGSLLNVAVGTAYGLKLKKSPQMVRCFLGDMTSFLGSFVEAVRYSRNFMLPIRFYIEDNGKSVITDTYQVMGQNYPVTHDMNPEWLHYIEYYGYSNDYPHSGIGQRISF